MHKFGLFAQSAFLSTGHVKRPILFFLLGSSLVAVFATALAVAPANEKIPRQTIVESLPAPDLQVFDNAQHVFFSETRIQRGDTLQRLLSRLNIEDSQATNFLRNDSGTSAMRSEFIAGRGVSASATGDGKLVQLQFPLNNDNTVLTVSRSGDQLFAKIVADRPEVHITSKSAQIEYSLFGATDAAGIPDSVAIQLAEIFSSEIDFHTDLRKGDRFSVIYEMRYQDGQPARSGRVISAEFVNAGEVYRALWHDQGDDRGIYLTPDGKPLQKAFLRSPLEFSRISSGFSRRFHPILKTWRAHQGVDYAAPTGTPVRATANGTVEFVGTQRGYGNVIVLRHDGKHSTLYAHLSRFSNGIRKGKRINQGETIGNVGQTGWATGPHLHYEFRINNQPVNPLSAKIPVLAPALSAAELYAFKLKNQANLALLERSHQAEIVYME
jgi:murein DD-endopeptidase MepM/ murein hydrolase activator NlpD